MTEEAIKLKAQIFARGYLISDILSKFYISLGLSRDQIMQMHERAAKMLGAQTIPGADPVQADMWTSEIQTAVSHLQSEAVKMWERATAQG
jgi:hypothetical protein